MGYYRRIYVISKHIAIVGYGKIARDQHVPSIAVTPGLKLVAVISRRGESPDGIPSFQSLDALAKSDIHVDAVAFCTPPDGRAQSAAEAAEFGWDILLEKPPGLNVAEVLELARKVENAGQILFTTWHSQYNAAVNRAAEYLADKEIRSMRIDWCEDVRKWHPGQEWIWEEGGFGVFDPGINALSIATRIISSPLELTAARLMIAENHASPIAADLDFGSKITANFDWREDEEECWQIKVDTNDGLALLDKGGSELWLNGELLVKEEAREYEEIYARFAHLLSSRKSHVDIQPLALVEQAMVIGERHKVEAFAA